MQIGKILRQALQLDRHGDDADEMVVKNQLAGKGDRGLLAVRKVTTHGPHGLIALGGRIVPGLRRSGESRMRERPLDKPDIAWLGLISVHPP